MSFASGSSHGLRYIKEREFGITPQNPVMTDMRITSCSLVLSKDSFQSNEIRQDAQISDLRHGVKQANGDIAFEFSYGAFDEFLAAAIRGEWDGDILRAGVQTPTFTFERVFTDIGQSQTFTGCAINTLALNIQANAMVTGSIGLVGKGSEFTNEPTAKETLPAPAHSPLDGFHGTLKVNGVANSVITSISLNIDNGIQAANVLSSDEAMALIPGRINASGSMSAFFEDLHLIDMFIKEQECEIEITLGDGGPGSYVITLPRVKYSGGSNPVDGEGPIMLDMPFQALLDECTGTNIQIERIPYPQEAAQPCSLAWSATEFNESVRNNGEIDETILVSLTGGNGKSFSGRDGAALPGVVFENLPEGLAGKALRINSANCKILILGQALANGEADSPEFGVRFTGAAFDKGFCHCLGDTVENSRQTIRINFMDGEPLPVEALTTNISTVGSEAELTGAPDGMYIVNPMLKREAE